MKFIANRKNLFDTLGRVLGAVDKRSTLPVLSHVLMTVYLRNAIGFVATDLEIRAAAECNAGVPAGGWQCCVPADKLKGILSSLSSAELRGELKPNGELILEADGARFALATLPAEEYPAALADDIDADIIFRPGTLPAMLRAVAHAASQNITKWNLCGIQLTAEGERLTAVATDGHRLSLAGISHDQAGEFGPGILLASKAARLIANISGTIGHGRRPDSNEMIFCADEVNLTARLVDGDFPDFRRVIPKTSTSAVHLVREVLIDALQACGVCSDDEGKSVLLQGAADSLTLSALGATATATIVIPCSQGEGFTARVNSRYLLQALAALSGEEVCIKQAGPTGPLLLVPVDHGGFDERLEVLMPMRV